MKSNVVVNNNLKLGCQECGRTIGADDLFCAGCHAPIVRRYCPKCSRLVPENTDLCPYCGAASNVQRGVLSRISLPWAPAAAVPCLLLALFLFTGSSNDEKKGTTAKANLVQTSAGLQSGRAIFKSKNDASTTAGSLSGSVINGDPAVAVHEGLQLNVQAHKLIKEGQFAEAVPILQKAVSLFPARTPVAKYALYNLGYALRKTGKVHEAIPVLEQCVQLDQSWDKARTELGIAKASYSPSPGM